MVEGAQERGYLEPAELEAFCVELDLNDQDVEELTAELERIGLEIASPRRDRRGGEGEGGAEGSRARSRRGRGARSAARATACSSSSPTSASTSCSPPPTR